MVCTVSISIVQFILTGGWRFNLKNARLISILLRRLFYSLTYDLHRTLVASRPADTFFKPYICFCQNAKWPLSSKINLPSCKQRGWLKVTIIVLLRYYDILRNK